MRAKRGEAARPTPLHPLIGTPLLQSAQTLRPQGKFSKTSVLVKLLVGGLEGREASETQVNLSWVSGWDPLEKRSAALAWLLVKRGLRPSAATPGALPHLLQA